MSAENTIDDDVTQKKHKSADTAIEPLPKELLMQFLPLYCRLCSVQLNSTVSAQAHYSSNNHEKKIRKFLIEYSQRNGEPLPKRARVCKSTKEDDDPKNFYCELCDLKLTGELHAKSHYRGQNHQRVLCGKTPAGKGQYDINGKWVRKLPSAPLPKSRQDNFGLEFVQPEQLNANDETTGKLQCDICSVAVTSAEQMEMHVIGKKHQKKISQTNQENPTKNDAGTPTDNILSSLSTPNPAETDLSIYRTPTGHYYCKPCNSTMNSDIQFKQHLNSKKHLNKNTRTQ